MTRKKYSAEEKVRIELPQGYRDDVDGPRAETSIAALYGREDTSASGHRHFHSFNTPNSLGAGGRTDSE